MKTLKQLFFMLLAACLPVMAHAQKDDSKYLEGAVPEKDGKVVFTQEFSIPGMQQDEIFDRIQQWMEVRLAKNENNSRVVYSDREKGEIVGIGDEWIVFSSSALSLDRTKILYQLTVGCQPEKCTFTVEKIRYNYREGKEKYTAEEWITDKYALNKSHTKLVRGLAKWRRKTVDFVDNLCTEVTEALGNNKSQTPAPTVTPAVVPNVKTPVVTIPRQADAPATSATAATYREVAPDALPANAIQIGAGKLVVVIGEEPFNMTTMTANAGGYIGKSGGKPAIFTIFSPDQPCGQLDKATGYTVRFYPNGATAPSVILACKQCPAPEAAEGMPRTYVGEIVQVKVLATDK